MPRRKQGVNLHGPYKHRDRWRVLRRAPGDADKWVSFETEAKAAAYLEEARRHIEGRRVSEAIKVYVESMKARGCAAESLIFATNRLKAAAPKPDELLSSITPARARALLEAVKGSVATRRETLKSARRWWRWLVEQGWARGAPWDGLSVPGQRSRGKMQLTGEEAQRLAGYCFAAATPGAIALMVALLLGLRRNEITGLTGRDVDQGGRLLWVRGTKTANAMRRLEVPDILARHLSAFAKTAGQLGPLFGVTYRTWMRDQAHKACDAAGVPRVCPHGLRGTFATLATSAGAAAHLVAASLGHGNSIAVAEAHYIRPEATRTAATGRVLSVLAGGRAGNG